MNSLQIINNNEYKRLNIIKKKFDIGLAILRTILSFFVIMTHCYCYNYAMGLWKFLIFKTKRFYFHVPIFFLMSFYFSQKTLSSFNTKKKVERFERLCIPYFFWPIIIFLLNKLLILFKITKNEIQIEHLKHQLLFGMGIMNMYILWYQWNIIFITFFFILVICLFRKYYNFVLTIILITAFVYQYNGKNVLIFGKYKESMVLGRVMEMIPFSVIGFLISYSDIIHILKNFRLKVLISCTYLLFFLYEDHIFQDIKGFEHNGIQFFLVSICIFVFFAMFPSEKIKNKIIIKIIKKLTNYTAGIYFIHVELSWCISKYIVPVKNKTINGCVIIYLLC